MNRLKDLPNISTVIASKLTDAGIGSCDELMSMGSREAFIRIRLRDNSVCLSMLYALEGAVQGTRWHNLPEEIKKDLKAFYNTL